MVVDLLLGGGWRGVECLRVSAGDARGARDGEIWCRGKERDEWAPLLSETGNLLLHLSQGLADNDQLLRARRIRGGIREPLGNGGLAKWVADLYRRAGLQGYTMHDLRRTFASLVVEFSGDQYLAQRLLRHGEANVTDRYVRRDLPGLLARFSPLTLVRLPVQERDLPGLPGRGDHEEHLWWRRGRVELPVH